MAVAKGLRWTRRIGCGKSTTRVFLRLAPPVIRSTGGHQLCLGLFWPIIVVIRGEIGSDMQAVFAEASTDYCAAGEHLSSALAEELPQAGPYIFRLAYLLDGASQPCIKLLVRWRRRNHDCRECREIRGRANLMQRSTSALPRRGYWPAVYRADCVRTKVRPRGTFDGVLFAVKQPARNPGR